MSLVAFLMLFATITVQAQGENDEWTEAGTYKIGASGQNLWMTINATGGLEWAAELPSDDPRQVWSIVDHRTPADNGLLEITAYVPGVGTFTMATNGVEGDHPNYTLIARPGEPVSVTPLDFDYSGLDQFQRRKTTSNQGGNDALFIKTPWGTNSRYVTAPSAAGDPVQFGLDGSAIGKLAFRYVGLPLSADENVRVSSNNVYPVAGNAGVFKLVESTEWTAYSISGTVVASGNGYNIDLSAFSKGLYIIKFDGVTKKVKR